MPVHTRLSMLLTLAGLLAAPGVHAADPAGILAGHVAQAGTPPDPARGQRFFTATHGGKWSCALCHGEQPVRDGRHASTGKSIAPLAPAFNPARFTDPAKVEKWFRRNCNDVVGRECSASEKADVLAWLISLKP